MRNSTFSWLFTVPGSKKLYILVLILANALYGASSVVYSLFLREIVDAATGGNRPEFWHYIILTGGLVAAQVTLRFIMRWLNELARASLENTFKGRLLNTLMLRDYLEVNAVHSAEWLNRLTNDAVVVANGYVDILPGFAGMAVRVVSAVVMIIVLEPRFAALLLPAALVFVGLTLLFRRVLKRYHKKVQEADGRLRIFLQERISSMLMIRSFAAEKQTMDEADEKMRGHLDARLKRNRFSNFANTGFGIAMSGLYLFGVGWCGLGILKGTVTFGTLTAMTHLISQIQFPLTNISGYLPRYYAMIASAERLMEAEAFDAGEEEACSLAEMKDFYDHRLQAIGLRDVTFSYLPSMELPEEAGADTQEMPEVLQHLSLEIRKGEYVAFTGHSGCGKSTALKLLMCVYRPDSGERYYISGEDARDRLSKRAGDLANVSDSTNTYRTGSADQRKGISADLTSAFRRLFAYVPQGNQLMNGTIREVVSFAEPEAANDDDRLRQALKVACAEEFIADLPDGPDTVLGERGAGLSEGQMQRLAIARAIFSGSPILLLDESTSALDVNTERQLLSNLREMTDKTVVIVTHREAALEICDRVVEFGEGTVIERENL